MKEIDWEQGGAGRIAAALEPLLEAAEVSATPQQRGELLADVQE